MGGELASGRWHTQAIGRRVVYLADHAALALLEQLVHVRDEAALPDTYQLLMVEIPDAEIQWHDRNDLTGEWSTDLRETQRIGNRFLELSKKLALMVPSVLVPFGNNCIFNPRAKGATEITIEVSGRYPFDARLR